MHKINCSLLFRLPVLLLLGLAPNASAPLSQRYTDISLWVDEHGEKYIEVRKDGKSIMKTIPIR